MNTLRFRLAVLLALAGCVATARMQEQIQIQTVDVRGDPVQGFPNRQFKTGTGRVRGRVTSAESGTPVRRAQVRIMGTDIAPKTAMTDAQGRFEFGDLPAGRFTLSSTKAGYVTVQYGQTRPYESGRAIELADKQTLDKADISMPRGSVITGRIVDEFGEPVADANVTAMRQQWVNGRRRLMSAGRNAQTNDLGQFRLYGLPPGDYYVSATVRNMDVMAMDMMAVMAPGGGNAGPSASAPGSGYAPTYFPGTTSAADAQRISVAVGQEAQGADFALSAVRLARISGLVMNSEGRPVDGAMVTPASSRGPEGMALLGGGARTNREGAFTLTNVAPGDYILQVRSVTIMTSSDGGGGIGSFTFTTRVAGGPGGSDSEFGALPLSVTGEDLVNVVITTTKGATAGGRVTFDGAQPPGSTLRVMPVSGDPESGPMGMPLGGGPGAALKQDGTFELKGLTGNRLFRITGLPTGWSVKSVLLNGSDVTDSGIDFKGTDTVTGIEIVASSKSTQISGTVTQGDGTPIKDYTIVVFSDDPQKWTAPATRWVNGARPDQSGRYQLRNLPAGGYYAIAVDYIPQGEWGDPEVLDRLKAKATRFTLTEGESKTLDLKLSEGS
jgi:carboxypeptidase family protein